MESPELFRFCRVCLVPEEDERFCSIFRNGGEIAHKLFCLTGIYPVDVDEKVPSLVCKVCVKEINAADLLRKRILDANEHLSMMTAEREIEMFEEQLEELKATIKIEAVKENERPEESKTKSKPESQNIIADSSTFYVPHVYLMKNPTKTAKTSLKVSESVEKAQPKKGTKRKKPQQSRSRKFKTTARKQVPTMFECDTCKDCFLSYKELNDHIGSHKSK